MWIYIIQAYVTKKLKVKKEASSADKISYFVQEEVETIFDLNFVCCRSPGAVHANTQAQVTTIILKTKETLKQLVLMYRNNFFYRIAKPLWV